MATSPKRLPLLSQCMVEKSADDFVEFFSALAGAVILGGYLTRCSLRAMESTCRTGYEVIGTMWAQARYLLTIQEAVTRMVEERRRCVIIHWHVGALFDTVSVDSSVDSSEDEEVGGLHPAVDHDEPPNPLPQSDSDDDPWFDLRDDIQEGINELMHRAGHVLPAPPPGSPAPQTPARRPPESPPADTPELSSSPATTLIMGPRSPGSQSV